MRILAFDTATRATTVALSEAGVPGEGTVEARDDPPPGSRPGHVSRLLPLIAEVMERGELGFTDVDRLAVGVGPGTFTGLRIGIATAQALARAASLPVVGVPTLRSLAAAAEGVDEVAGLDAVAAVLDARRGEVYAGVWRLGGESVMEARALAPEQLASWLERSRLRLLAVGEGAIEFRGILRRSGAHIPPDESELHRVSAAAHLRIAEQLPAGSADEIQPQYIRLPDVREPASKPAAQASRDH